MVSLSVPVVAVASSIATVGLILLVLQTLFQVLACVPLAPIWAPLTVLLPISSPCCFRTIPLSLPEISSDKTAAHLTQTLCVCVCVWMWMRSVGRVNSAVTGLHMLICCTCGSGIGRAGVVRVTPYPFPSHPIHPDWMWLSIHTAFTVEGGGWRMERGDGGRDHGHRGREVVFLFSLAQRDGKTIGVQIDASSYSLRNPPFIATLPLSLSLPSFSIHPSHHLWRFGVRIIAPKSGWIKLQAVYLVIVCILLCLGVCGRVCVCECLFVDWQRR